jgi:hypothetical protein
VEIGGSGGLPPENFGIFELPILGFLQFQHDFSSFSDKKGLLLGGQNPSVEGPTQGLGGFGPSSIYVKRGPALFYITSLKLEALKWFNP